MHRTMRTLIAAAVLTLAGLGAVLVAPVAANAAIPVPVTVGGLRLPTRVIYCVNITHNATPVSTTCYTTLVKANTVAEADNARYRTLCKTPNPADQCGWKAAVSTTHTF